MKAKYGLNALQNNKLYSRDNSLYPAYVPHVARLGGKRAFHPEIGELYHELAWDVMQGPHDTWRGAPLFVWPGDD
jgi:hypothetical protein